jgi:HlyD family secretion protein
LAKLNTKRALKWLIPVLGVIAVAFIGLRWWQGKKAALPLGIVSGNGRLEAKLVDVAAKEPLRVDQVLVAEGAVVRPGQVLVKLDTTTLQSELAEANAAIAAEQEHVALSRAQIVKSQSEIELAEVEARRAKNLVAEGAGSQRDLDVRNTKVDTSKAALAEAQASLQTSLQRVEEARAKAATVQTRIEDATLKSPVNGRVLYRLAEAGEVLQPGGKALTLVNLDDVYMEIFLPAEQAARAKIGSEGRITVDYDPTRAIAAYVSFVSPEAQFTPKQVETQSEREKLMFRVKLQVPKEIATQYMESIKTGVRGVGYVRINDSAQWPERLQNVVSPQPAAIR